jgi:hypothetical protein
VGVWGGGGGRPPPPPGRPGRAPPASRPPPPPPHPTPAWRLRPVPYNPSSPHSECGGVPLFVAILRDSTRPIAQAQAMAVVSALSASPAAQEEIAAAGGVPALVGLLAEPLPRTQVRGVGG